MITPKTTDQWEQELNKFRRPVSITDARQQGQRWIEDRMMVGVDAIFELIRIRKALEALATINKHDEGLCQNCGKPLPGTAPANMKYCMVNCRQRAYEKRKAMNQITIILNGENP